MLLLECKSNPWQHCPRRWIHTHTVDDVQTKEFVWTLMEEKDLVRERGG
jgi:hypothetical protein